MMDDWKNDLVLVPVPVNVAVDDGVAVNDCDGDSYVYMRYDDEATSCCVHLVMMVLMVCLDYCYVMSYRRMWGCNMSFSLSLCNAVLRIQICYIIYVHYIYYYSTLN